MGQVDLLLAALTQELPKINTTVQMGPVLDGFPNI
jgi:hypothetical protein